MLYCYGHIAGHSDNLENLIVVGQKLIVSITAEHEGLPWRHTEDWEILEAHEGLGTLGNTWRIGHIGKHLENWAILEAHEGLGTLSGTWRIGQFWRSIVVPWYF